MTPFTLPQISENASRQEQTRQMRAYMFQLKEQVQAMLMALDTDSQLTSEAVEKMNRDAAKVQTDLTRAQNEIGALGKNQVIQGNEAPERPVAGTIWLDTSGDYPVYRRYDGERWVQISDYGAIAGQTEQITQILETISEDGIARLISSSRKIADQIVGITNTSIIQGADGIEARLTRVETGTRPIVDWIKWGTYEGETGLMIGADYTKVWIFITNTALTIMNGNVAAASFSLNRATMNDAATKSGMTFGDGEHNLRFDFVAGDGLVVRPE